ncbi:type 2 isopentenyl-diphosphate Delta-isomerase [Lacticaseibacillus songhuajiangensis]|jgi:isopentenyl-diphosphate delta-isomerase|uniref:type 2 isopentenyl-diphosphate Delta-isomerase n=1 Tax=Lacticaseibacillus songhuajiangensis TaxID=1296539 RepID=UPI000F7911CD|nr:type 2 isopentenyl-diphosphate Delta-isomerase [Lacticaseibacillus songhuajiangensis]
MTKQSLQSHRKDEHYFLAEKFYQEHARAGFDQLRFVRSALPEVDVAEVDLHGQLGPHQTTWPIFINAMTGGSHTTRKVNAALARIARVCQLPMATGSGSVLLSDHDPEVRASFTDVRKELGNGLLLANVGVDKTPAQAQEIVAILQADMLEVHINVPQEIVMPEGERNFHWYANLKAIQEQVSVPVIAKEVGFGMRQDDFTRIAETGVAAIDVGGRGGTNFAQIENVRRPHGDYSFLTDFGQTTVESLLEAEGYNGQLIATGGVRTPLDVLKALRLGATGVGIAGLILHWLTKFGEEDALQHLQDFLAQVRSCMVLLGARNVAELRQVPIVYSEQLLSYARQRGLELP